MYGLFELSIVLSRMVYRWREGRDASDSGPVDEPPPPQDQRDEPRRLGAPA
jgi:cell division septation protein DedD